MSVARGPFDYFLEWPFLQSVRLTLVQLGVPEPEQRQNVSRVLDPVSYFGIDPAIVRARVAAAKGLENAPPADAGGHAEARPPTAERTLAGSQTPLRAAALPTDGVGVPFLLV